MLADSGGNWRVNVKSAGVIAGFVVGAATVAAFGAGFGICESICAFCIASRILRPASLIASSSVACANRCDALIFAFFASSSRASRAYKPTVSLCLYEETKTHIDEPAFLLLHHRILFLFPPVIVELVIHVRPLRRIHEHPQREGQDVKLLRRIWVIGILRGKKEAVSAELVDVLATGGLWV